MTESRSNPETNRAIAIVGREAIYARLQQHVLDPPNRQAIVFTGQDGIGKTALLQHFPTLYDNQILGVYMPLATAPLESAEAWVDYLLRQTNEMLAQHDFTLERISQQHSDDMRQDDWLRDVYLFEVMHMIRPQRRIVWLFDDVDYLLDALPEQILYLQQLLQTHLQLAIILTLATEHESRLSELEPLADTSTEERLHRLPLNASIELIRLYAPGASDDIVNAVYEATGGHPYLLTNFGYELHKSWASKSDSEALQSARAAAYAASNQYFRHMWQILPQNERLVLTAIASIIYDDPLQKVGAEHIEAWLIETDYPLDKTTIHAALRGLDYQEIVTYQRHMGHKFIAGMMQTWLLENARLDAVRGHATLAFPVKISRRFIIALSIAIVLLIVLLFVLPTPTLGPAEMIPTVTLAQ